MVTYENLICGFVSDLTACPKDSVILDYQKKGSGLSDSLDSDSDSVVAEGFID